MKYLLVSLFFSIQISTVAKAQVQYDEREKPQVRFSDIYKKAAQVLSEMKCPEFYEFDGHFVKTAFDNVYADPNWIAKFSQDITLRSPNHDVRLLPNENPSDNIQTRGPATYFWLQNATVRREILIGPYSNPVGCGDIQPIPPQTGQ